MNLTSQVLIAAQLHRSLEKLVSLRTEERMLILVTPQVWEEIRESEGPLADCRGDACRILITEKKSFRLEDAKTAVEKAYMAHESETVIILAAKEFSVEVQNKLLKVIEEPPPRISFILLLSSKASLLPTIRSRLPVSVAKEQREILDFELDMERLDLASVYAFIQKHKRLVDKTEAKILVEKISSEAIKSRRYRLDEQTLQLFHRAFRALDVGSPPQFVLTGVLLKLLARKKKG